MNSVGSLIFFGGQLELLKGKQLKKPSIRWFLLFQIFLSQFQPFLPPFIDDFRNLAANPGEGKEDEENRDFVENRMIRIDDDIQHGDEQHDETNENGISYLRILHDHRRDHTAEGYAHATEKQQCHKKGILILHSLQQALPMLERGKLLVGNPAGVDLYP